MSEKLKFVLRCILGNWLMQKLGLMPKKPEDQLTEREKGLMKANDLTFKDGKTSCIMCGGNCGQCTMDSLLGLTVQELKRRISRVGAK